MKEFLKKHPYRYVSTLAVFTEVSHMMDFNIYRLPGKEKIRNVYT